MQVNFGMDDQSGLLDFLVTTTEITNVILEPSLNELQSCTNSIIYIKASIFAKQPDQGHLHLRILNLSLIRPMVATLTVNTHSTINPPHKSFEKYERFMRNNIVFNSHVVDNTIKFRIKTSQQFPAGKINNGLMYSFTVGIVCQMTKEIVYVTTDWLKIKIHANPRAAVGEWTSWKSTMQPDRIITLEKQVLQLQDRISKMERFIQLVSANYRESKKNPITSIIVSKKRVKLQHV